MGIYFRYVSIFVAFSALFLTGCKESEKSKIGAPAATPGQSQDFDKYSSDPSGKSSTCDRPEDNLPSLEEASRTPLIIESETSWQDFESIDCKGEITRGFAPVQDMKTKILIPGERALEKRLVSISAENFRTCKHMIIKADRQKLGPYRIKTGNGRKLDIDASISNATRSGDLELFLTDSTNRFIPFMNIREGVNVIHLKYLGACLKYHNPLQDGQPRECLDAEVLKEKYILVEARLKRTRLPGVRKINFCSRR